MLAEVQDTVGEGDGGGSDDDPDSALAVRTSLSNDFCEYCFTV